MNFETEDLRKRSDMNSQEDNKSSQFMTGSNHPEVKSSVNGNNAMHNLVDLDFVPKLVNMGKEISLMAKMGLNAQELNRIAKHRFSSLSNEPGVFINVNIHLNDVSSENKKDTVRIPEDIPLSSNKRIENLNINNKSSADPLVNTHTKITDFPRPIRNTQKVLIPDKDFAKSHIDKAETNQPGQPILNKIRKKKLCKCSKKKSLEELIRKERLFNKQTEKVKYFWRGTNNSQPFTFKKKIMDYYEETNEVLIKEIIDFSKKFITADELSHENLK